MSSKAAETNQPWMAHLYEEFIYCEKGTVEHDIASIIQCMLLSGGSNNDSTPYAAAHQIDRYYWDRNLDSGPLFRYQGDQPFPDVLNIIYSIILDVAPLLHYNDMKQEMLVQLVFELHKIPPRPVKAWNGDRLVHPDDTLFAEMLDHAWGGNFEWESDHKNLVNFSAFLARCIAAHVDNHVDTGKYPKFDFQDALEQNNPPGIKRDTRVMIAAQYILLAGSTIHEELVQKTTKEGKSWGLDKWKLWAERFKEITEQEELDPNVKIAAVEAHQKMISLHPELFPVMEGDNKADCE